jgi:hypothetical protein
MSRGARVSIIGGLVAFVGGIVIAAASMPASLQLWATLAGGAVAVIGGLVGTLGGASPAELSSPRARPSVSP